MQMHFNKVGMNSIKLQILQLWLLGLSSECLVSEHKLNILQNKLMYSTVAFWTAHIC